MRIAPVYGRRVADFLWRDGERVLRFGRGARGDARELLGEGALLLSTPRARDAAPEVAALGGTVVDVPGGPVDRVAAEVLDGPAGAAARHHGPVDVVALGGGRVVDVAKAVAAARGGLRVGAVPTSLSAAEMSRGHRHAVGIDPATPRVRPSVVLNDPALSASQPEDELAASAANALAHAAEAPVTVAASPVPTLVAQEAARLLGRAWDPGGAVDRDALALGALLSGYALDAAGLGLHHVLAQTAVRVAGAGHGASNAALLPHTLGALERRGLAGAPALAPLAAELAARAGARTLREAGAREDALEACVEAALGRPELARTPPAADAAEVRALLTAAW